MMQLKRAALAALILTLCLAVVAAAGEIPVGEAGLNPAGEVYEINPDAAGGLILSDYGANEVWRVAAISGAYTSYTGVPTPSDARADAAGDIWWVNYDDGATLGRINTAAGTVTTWDFYDWNRDREYYLSGLAVDAGKVWVSESFGAGGRLYRFDPASGQLCAYGPPGVISYYLALRDGQIWLADWFTDRLMRFDPAGNQATWWQFPPGTAQGLALDAAGDVWLADEDTDSLYRLHPEAGELTVYALPAGVAPYMLAAAADAIWYSAAGNGAAGTVGRLDPAVAAGQPSTPATGTESWPQPTCASLGSGTTIPVSSATGALAWAETTWPSVVDADGWQVYALPAGASPYGIAAAGNYLWVGDWGRQVLARTALVPMQRVYLPLVVR